MIDFLKELTRRKVWLFGGIYLALGWVVLQVAIAIESTMKLPDWIDQSVLVLLVLGFPVALLLAWAQESQPKSHGAGAVDMAGGVDVQQASGLATTVDWHPGFSVAVLPFNDLSPDGTFAQISDGISEDILTHLSALSILKVAARNSSFAFKGQSPDIRDVGQKINVQFVLEGSFRQIGENVRLTAQLLDAVSGNHLWSDNYDRDAATLNTELDEDIETIVGQIVDTIETTDRQRLMALERSELSVDELIALAHLLVRRIEFTNWRDAESLMTLALERAPGSRLAHALMANIQAGLPVHGWGDRAVHWSRAAMHLESARSGGTPEIETLIALAGATFYMARTTDCKIYTEQMREIAPRHPATWYWSCVYYNRTGQFEEVIEAGNKGLSRCPRYSSSYTGLHACQAYGWLGLREFARAEDLARTVLSMREGEDIRPILIIALAHQGRIDEAARELETSRKNWQDGEMSLAKVERSVRRRFDDEDFITLYLEGYRLAGLE